MEAELINSVELMHDLPDRREALLSIEVKILRTQVRNDLRLPGHANRIDPDRWRPMIMSFQELYGLAPKSTQSKLATIDEERYRTLTRSDVVKQGGDMDLVNREESAATD
jgi:hypothetical protein